MGTLSDTTERVFIASAHTLCDRCPAIARAAVEVDADTDLLLYFCGHHLREHEDALLGSGYTIYEDVLT